MSRTELGFHCLVVIASGGFLAVLIPGEPTTQRLVIMVVPAAFYTVSAYRLYAEAFRRWMSR